jgi:DNA adenine methylase
LGARYWVNLVPFYTPLRYPGGKRKLVNYFKRLFEINGFTGGKYVEPFAGGAAVALALLLDGYAREVWINDVDPGIYSFWLCVKEAPEELCRKIRDVAINMDEWYRQKAVQDAESPDFVDLAFSTLFLNRTNRSGIIRGGVIGGKGQEGGLKLDVRFNRENLIARIEKIADKADRLSISCIDALALLKEISSDKAEILIFLDPPYYLKRNQLYRDDYSQSDHEALAEIVRNLDLPWVLTYNNCQDVQLLYSGMPTLVYDLHYAAARRYQGSEIMVFSNHIKAPNVPSPALL